jgi:hypothetical protein
MMHVRDGGSEYRADPDRGVLRGEVDGEHALLGGWIRGQPAITVAMAGNIGAQVAP